MITKEEAKELLRKKVTLGELESFIWNKYLKEQGCGEVFTLTYNDYDREFKDTLICGEDDLCPKCRNLKENEHGK